MKQLIILSIVVAFTSMVLVQGRYVSINMSLGVTLSEEPRQLTEEMTRICVKETEMSMDELQRFNNNEFHNSTEATQCFAHCMYEQLGILKDGVFVERDLIAEVSSVLDPKHHVPRECRILKGVSKCEAAYKMHLCAQEHKSRDALGF